MSDAIFRELVVRLPRDRSLDFTRALDEGGALSGLSGYYETLYEAGKSADGPVEMRLYFPLQEEQAALQVELLLTALAIAPFSIEAGSVERDQYLEAYKQFYLPFYLTRRIFVVPSWERTGDREAEAVRSGAIPLYLDPGIAFGTGKHATTVLCAQFIEDLQPAGMRIIDAGAGSGILSLIALLYGARSALAFDIDGNAALAIRENVAANHPRTPAERLQVRRGGFELDEFLTFEADWLIANITAATILQNQPRIECGRFQRILFSGILAEADEEIIAAFAGRWRLIERRVEDGWSMLALEKRD